LYDSVVKPLLYDGEDMYFPARRLATSSVAPRGTSTVPVNGDTTEEVLDKVDREVRGDSSRSDSRCPTAVAAPLDTSQFGRSTRRRDGGDEHETGDVEDMYFPARGLTTSSVAPRGSSTVPVNGDTTEEVLDKADREVRGDSSRSDSCCPTAVAALLDTSQFGRSTRRRDGGDVFLRDASLASTSSLNPRYSRDVSSELSDPLKHIKCTY